jgi:hypothetical protein
MEEHIKSATIKLDNLLKGKTTHLYGDVNGDGSVNAADVTALYAYILNGTDTFIATSDVNGDKSINAADVTAVYSIILGNPNAAQEPPAQVSNKPSDKRVKVGPVPSSDYIVASADSYIHGVELYDMKGNLVARNGGNYVNVGDIKSGNYILKVYTTNDITSHHVAVAH